MITRVVSYLIGPKGDNINLKDKAEGAGSIYAKNGLSYREHDDRNIILPYMECLFNQTLTNCYRHILNI